jgi:hypothetical protein
MYVCMYVCTCMYVCVCVCMCLYVCTYVRVHAFTSVRPTFQLQRPTILHIFYVPDIFRTSNAVLLSYEFILYSRRPPTNYRKVSVHCTGIMKSFITQSDECILPPTYVLLITALAPHNGSADISNAQNRTQGSYRYPK